MTSNGAPVIAVAETPTIGTPVTVRPPPTRPSSAWTVLGLADDLVLLVLAVILLPLVIILAGAPIALLVRLVMAIAHRF
jgi:hypothetical protein